MYTDKLIPFFTILHFMDILNSHIHAGFFAFIKLNFGAQIVTASKGWLSQQLQTISHLMPLHSQLLKLTTYS